MSELCFPGLIKSQFHQSLVIKADNIINHKIFSGYHLTVKGQLPANAFMYLLM